VCTVCVRHLRSADKMRSVNGNVWRIREDPLHWLRRPFGRRIDQEDCLADPTSTAGLTILSYLKKFFTEWHFLEYSGASSVLLVFVADIGVFVTFCSSMYGCELWSQQWQCCYWVSSFLASKRSTRFILSCVFRGSPLVHALIIARYNSVIGSNALFCCERYKMGSSWFYGW